MLKRRNEKMRVLGIIRTTWMESYALCGSMRKLQLVVGNGVVALQQLDAAATDLRQLECALHHDLAHFYARHANDDKVELAGCMAKRLSQSVAEKPRHVPIGEPAYLRKMGVQCDNFRAYWLRRSGAPSGHIFHRFTFGQGPGRLRHNIDGISNVTSIDLSQGGKPFHLRHLILAGKF